MGFVTISRLLPHARQLIKDQLSSSRLSRLATKSLQEDFAIVDAVISGKGSSQLTPDQLAHRFSGRAGELRRTNPELAHVYNQLAQQYAKQAGQAGKGLLGKKQPAKAQSPPQSAGNGLFESIRNAEGDCRIRWSEVLLGKHAAPPILRGGSPFAPRGSVIAGAVGRLGQSGKTRGRGTTASEDDQTTSPVAASEVGAPGVSQPAMPEAAVAAPFAGDSQLTMSDPMTPVSPSVDSDSSEVPARLLGKIGQQQGNREGTEPGVVKSATHGESSGTEQKLPRPAAIHLQLVVGKLGSSETPGEENLEPPAGAVARNSPEQCPPSTGPQRAGYSPGPAVPWRVSPEGVVQPPAVAHAA